MKRLLSGIYAVLISAAGIGLTTENACASQLPDSIVDSHQSVGLVLSGGGAKGIAHIGVIQALEDNDIPIDFVTGTSMGAIVGGLYASGYTPSEMLDLILSRGFSYWSTGKVDPRLTYYFSNEEPTPVMLSVPIARKDSANNASAVPASLINPMPMSFAFMELFSGYTAQCGRDFNKLFVPYRCVASDPAAKRKVVFSNGDLGDAVRASMSFPIVFQPITIDSALLYDGGIYDNFPVDVMERDFAPSIMIGVDVSTSSTGPQTSLMDQIENLVIQNNDYYMPPERGIKMHIDLNEFSLLDFPKAKQIYDIGYAHAMEMIDSIKDRIPTRMPAEARNLRRAVFKSCTPYVRFDSVCVTGASPRQNNFIGYIFDPTPGDTFGIAEARRAYYRAISPGLLRDLFPQSSYNQATGLFKLNLKASVKDNFRVGFGGFLTSSTNSYIFVNAGYSSLSFNSMSANVNAWVGQSYMAGMFTARMALRTPNPTAISLEGVLSRSKFYENDYLFYEDKMPTFILNHEYFARLKYGIAMGSRSKIDIGAGYGLLYDSFYRSNDATSYETGRDKSKQYLGQFFARFTSNTLSNINYPVSGSSYDIAAMAITGNYKLHPAIPTVESRSSHPHWLQIESRTRNYFTLGSKFALGLESDIMLSTRKLLPDYNSAIISAPAYRPTPASYNSFNPGLRANSFIAAALVPVFNFSQNLSARLGLHGFLPLRKILEDPETKMPCYGKWFHDPEFFGEADITYTFPFATLSGYCNYSTAPKSTWNVGISFGVFILAPKFLR